MLYWCAWGLLRALLFLRARLIITGLETLPKKGSLILVSNHISGFDPVLIGLAISKRRIRFMAKSELFHFIPFGWILWNLGAYPVNRMEITKSFLKQTLSILRSNQALLIFGEGTRNRTSAPMLPLKIGFAFLSEMAPAPVIPVFITGSKSMASARFRPTIKVRFGNLIPSGLKQTILEQSMNAFSQFISAEEGTKKNNSGILFH